MKTLALLLISASLCAHDLYLRPKSFRPSPGATLRIEYHNGDRFPSSEVPVKIDRLRDMKFTSAGAETPFANLRIEGAATVADVMVPDKAGSFILTSRTIPSFIELAPAKFEGYLKHEGLEEVIAWRKKNGESTKPGREMYSKYAKAVGFVGSATPDYGVIAGLTIELIPLANPNDLAPGGVLPVRLLFRGKPAAGLAIEASNASAGKVTEAMIGRTDEKGELRIPIERPGLWKLHTVLMERRTDRKEADWESFWASLTFEVATSD